MTYLGTVQDGLVVLADGSVLPNGTAVSVVPVAPATSEPADEETPTIWEKLTALARKYENLPCDLPEDLAINHDHYLHGLPKRQ